MQQTQTAKLLLTLKLHLFYLDLVYLKYLNGQISGDPTNVNANTTYSFTLGASDGEQTVTRNFSIVVNKTLDGSTAARAAAQQQQLKVQLEQRLVVTILLIQAIVQMQY